MTTAQTMLLSLFLVGCDAAAASSAISTPNESHGAQQTLWRDDSDPEIANLAGVSQARIDGQRRLCTERVVPGGG